ncbi:integrase [Kribbella sp. NPDC051587]|uniref:integrase n=1 Tax=Kribbella sp. NPDC051587 TaxID=3364119 RepID=UPI0037ACAC2E
MQPADSAFAQHVLARMTDYFLSEGVPWTRRLWDIGSILGLEELAEACEWQSRKVLSSTAVAWQRAQLQGLVGPDKGIGDRELRRELMALLQNGLVAPSPQHRRLRQLIDHAKAGYLDRWVAALSAEPSVKPERLARTLSAHLLDLGFSAPYLAQHWVTDLRRAHADTHSIVESAAALAAQHEQTYDVLIAFARVPKGGAVASHPQWMPSAQVVQWLHDHGLPVAGVRAAGGVTRQISARDPLAAAAKAREVLERMVARAWFVRRGRGDLEPLDVLWVSGYPSAIASETPSRSADVLSLVHKGQLFDVSAERTIVDDALELAAPINRGGLPGPAVAGGWAAVESLLTHPGDPVDDNERGGKAVAADRLAAIVACSWPRAELTTLVHRHTGKDDLADLRDACETNHARSAVLLAELQTHGTTRLTFRGKPTWRSDMAAADRMQHMIENPLRVLGEVQLAAQIAFRRLYRARNVVLHGGSTSSIALDATLRTAAPLLGAGLDRITHHYLEDQLAPLDTAARAEMGLRLVGGETGLSAIDLLQKPGSRVNHPPSPGPAVSATALAEDPPAVPGMSAPTTDTAG